MQAGSVQENKLMSSATEPLVGTRPQCEQQGKMCWMKTIFGMVMFGLVLAVLILTIDNHNKLKDQNDDLALLKSLFVKEAAPLKFAVENVGPRKYQGSRGTCWGFGTIAAVEYQYRQQGIANGWLSKDQYMLFSEQAYGNQITRLCQQHRMQCLLPGDHVAFNSTEGGEAHLLYVFRRELSNALLPVTVCPYQEKDDQRCDGIDQAIVNNPVKWSMSKNGLSTFYNIEEMKAQLAAKNRAMAISVPIFETAYYIGCTDPNLNASTTSDCLDLTKCVTPCPPQLNFKDACCHKFDQPMWNMNGEFKKHHALDPEAGHVMMLVGYNDDYETEDGAVGGFIMRNTWRDGVYALDEFGNIRNRGSHSLQFFMGEISAGDERAVCPNGDNPRSWYSCGRDPKESLDDAVKDCVNKDTNDTAAALYQPFLLHCRDAKRCLKADNIKYYNLNVTNYGDDLHIMCFMQVQMIPGQPPKALAEMCYPPDVLDEFSKLFGPEENYPNSENYCGFYFFPYELGRESNAKLGGFFVNDYDITFDAQSYEANKNADKDYKLVHDSTHSQPPFPVFNTPYPNSDQE